MRKADDLPPLECRTSRKSEALTYPEPVGPPRPVVGWPLPLPLPLILHQHFPQFVCCAQCGCFLQFLNFVLSRCVAQVLSEWFWDGSSRPCYWLVSLLLSHSTCAEFLLWGLCMLKSSWLLSSPYFCLMKLLHLLTCMFLVYYRGLWCPVYYYYYYYY